MKSAYSFSKPPRLDHARSLLVKLRIDSTTESSTEETEGRSRYFLFATRLWARRILDRFRDAVAISALFHAHLYTDPDREAIRDFNLERSRARGVQHLCVRALPKSACFLKSPCAFYKNSFSLGARQKCFQPCLIIFRISNEDSGKASSSF
jgi:hypothetical protein